MTNKRRVLILCTGNSARSQMAEGLLRQDAGELFEVFSGGLEPSFVRPLAIEAMREVGIDISGQRSKSVEEFAGEEVDYVITVCDNANERYPDFPERQNTSTGALKILPRRRAMRQPLSKCFDACATKSDGGLASGFQNQAG